MTTTTVTKNSNQPVQLTLTQGFDRDFALTFYEDDGVTPKSPMYTRIKWSLRKGYADPVALTADSSVAGNSYITIATNTAAVHFSYLDTATLSAPQTYVYDVRCYLGSAEVKAFGGTISVTPKVTNA